MISNVLLVNALKCFVTEHEPAIAYETNEVIIDNGTAWKWWPMSEIHKAEEKECDNDWATCVSRQPINRTAIAILTRNGSITTSPTPPVPNECIACGKATWRRIGVGMEEGKIFVSLGCYGSELARHYEQKSCIYRPRASACSPAGTKAPGRADVGGDICSKCYCTEDGCNGSSTLIIIFLRLLWA